MPGFLLIFPFQQSQDRKEREKDTAQSPPSSHKVKNCNSLPVMALRKTGHDLQNLSSSTPCLCLKTLLISISYSL